MFHTGLLVLAPLSVLGMHTIALREVSANIEDPGMRKGAIVSTLRRAALISATITSVAYLLTIAGMQVVDPDWSWSLVVAFFLTSFVSSISLTLGNQLQGMRKFNVAVVVLNLSAPLLTIVLMSFFSVQSLDGAVYALSLSVLGTALIAAFSVFVEVGKVTINDGYSLGRNLDSLKHLTIVFLAIQSVNWAGILLGGIFLPPEEVAKLSVMLRTANVINFILIVANFLVSPCIAWLWRSGRDADLEYFVQTTSLYMMFPLVVASGFMVVFSDEILSLFGHEYNVASHYLLVLLIGQFVNVATGTVNALLTMSENERSLMLAVSVSGLLSVMGVIVVAPIAGLSGVVFITAGSLVIQNLIAVILVKKKLGFWIYKFGLNSLRVSNFGRFKSVCEGRG